MNQTKGITLLTFFINDDFINKPIDHMTFQRYSEHGSYSQNRIHFIFDVTKLPTEFNTIWEGNSTRGFKYNLNFLHHIAETYLEKFDPKK
jgi:hypothetical protein